MRNSPEITIHLVNGSAIAVPITPSCTRRWRLMEEDSITLSFNWETAIGFTIGDYIQDEIFGRFYITENVTPPDTNGGAFKYTVRFDREYIGWKNLMFQMTRNINGWVRKESDWVLTQSLHAHVQEVIKNLAILGESYRYCFGSTIWKYSSGVFITDGEIDTPFEAPEEYTSVKNIAYSGTNIYTALKNGICDAYRCEFWVVDDILCLGKCELGETIDFKISPTEDDITFFNASDGRFFTSDNQRIIVDLGTGAINVESFRPSKSNSEYANRIYAFGSTKNIPYSYRKKLVFNNDDSKTEDSVSYFRDSVRRLYTPMVKGVSESRSFKTEKYVKGDIVDGQPYYGEDARWALSEIYEVIPGEILRVNEKFLWRKDTEVIGDAFELYARVNSEYQKLTYTRVQELLVTYLQFTIPQGADAIVFHAIEDATYLNDNIAWDNIVSTTVIIHGVESRDINVVIDGTTYSTTFKVGDGGGWIRVPSGVSSFTTFSIPDEFLVISLIKDSYYTSDYGDPSSLAHIGDMRLMLPVGTNYIGENDIQANELVEKVVYFENIYPQCALRITDISTVTGMSTKETFSDGSSQRYSVTRYTVKAKLITVSGDVDFPFDRSMILPGQALQIKFLTREEEESYGARSNSAHHLAGMTFDVRWNQTDRSFTIVWNQTYGAQLPNEVLCPQVGDSFILVGWNTKAMSSLNIISAAEQKLKLNAEKYMAAVKDAQFTYDCNLMSGQYDFLFGQKARVYDESHPEGYYQSRIIGYELKLDIPEDSPTITVGDTEAYSRLRALEKTMNITTGNVSTSGAESSSYSSESDATATSVLDVWRSLTNDDGLTEFDENTKIDPAHLDASSGGSGNAKHAETADRATLADTATVAIDANSADYAKDSDKWDGKQFDDYLNQGVKTSDNVTFNKVTTGDVISPNYAQGSAGYRLVNSNGNASLELDDLTVRKTMKVFEYIIQQIHHQGGVVIYSAASIECTDVVETSSGYKCFFDTKEDINGNAQVPNLFQVGDQARCQRFQLASTTAKYYWRLVTEVGTDYIVLSKTDCDANSGIPAVGDNIIQLGNRTNVNRQNAEIITTTDNNSPRTDYYKGINSYDLSGKLITTVGVRDGEVGVYTKNGSFEGVVTIKGGSGLNTLDEWQGLSDSVAQAKSAADAAQADATLAKTTAENAKTSADAANTRLSSWADNGYISPQEKYALKQEKLSLDAEYNQLLADATKYGIASSIVETFQDAYDDADNAFVKYTADTPENILIDADYDNIVNYYAARTTFANAIADAAKAVADTAKATADAANGKATALQEIIGKFTDDGYISPQEKRALLNTYNNEQDIKDTICATAANYSLDTTEVESYYDTYGDVIDYYCIYVKQLYDGRNNPYGWDDSIPIDNTHYPLSAIQDYFDAKAALQDEIDTAVSNSLDAKAAKSDVQYLTAALAKDETVITGGLVLSSFIGVKDSNGVQAAINASTAVDGFNYKAAFSAVGDHGRLMIAAGINGVTTAYSTAATRIFEDGTVITNQLNATEATITSATITKTQNPFVRITGSFSAIQVDNIYTPTPDGGMRVTLDWTTASSGRRMTLAGGVLITAPSGQYFYENGRKFKTLETSYEITEILGWGTETSFLGWVIVSRTMFQTYFNTGGKMFNPIAFGKVTTTGVGTNASFVFVKTVSLYKSDGETKYTIDGENEISVVREGVGRYVIRVPRGWFATDVDGDGIEKYVYVDVVGYGTVIDGSGGSSAVKASVVSIRTESAAGSDGTIYKRCAITIDTADDATSNDGKFFFKIYNMAQWDI